MKNLLKIGIVLSILGSFAACEKDTMLIDEWDALFPPYYKEYYYYALQNKSGHTIAIVQKPACREMTDSLVLFDGTAFGFDTDNHNSGSYFFYQNVLFESRAIYYDSRYKLDFSKRLGFDVGRRFFDEMDYLVSKSSDWKVFTFTEADYQYAVEHGKDLGEPKQVL